MPGFAQMDQSPISRVSGFALAASLANLAGCAGLTSQSLWTFQSNFKEVPPEIRYLLEDVKILQSLLLSVENLSRVNTDADLPPELQSIWQRIEKSLHTGLESLQKLVSQFQKELGGSSITRDHLLARLRHASSDGAVVDLRRILKSHIQALSFVDMLLAQRHLITSQEYTHTDELAEKISDEFAFCKDEGRAINDVLMEMRNPSNNESTEPRRFINQATPNSTDTDLNMHTTIHRGKRRRRILWKWSLYDFPMGTLTTEALLTEEQQEKHFEDTKQKFQITFNFKPPSWLMNYLLQINYTLVMRGSSIPYWQRTRCGALSLLPNELRDCLEEGDCLAASDCFLKISLHDTLRLCESKYLNAVPVPSHTFIMPDPAGRSIFVRACSMSFDAHIGPLETPKRYGF